MRKQIDDNYAHNYKCQAYDGRKVKMLTEHDQTNDGYENYANGRPDGIGNAHGQRAQGNAKAVERDAIACNCQYRWQKPRELLALLQAGCGNCLKNNRQKEDEVSLYHKFSYSCTFSRHGKAQASLALLIWLNEKVRFWLQR